MAMVAATGVEACNTDPLISSAAVAGASVSVQNTTKVVEGVRQVPDKKIVGKVNHASRNESKTNEGKEKCWIHEDGSHPVWNCKVCQMMNIKEKIVIKRVIK